MFIFLSVSTVENDLRAYNHALAMLSAYPAYTQEFTYLLIWARSTG